MQDLWGANSVTEGAGQTGRGRGLAGKRLGLRQD